MVSEEEQIHFFNTIFAPLREKVSVKDAMKAKSNASGFLMGECFGNMADDVLEQWNLDSLTDEEIESWKWLMAMRQKYHEFNENEQIKVHKFVWHKKPNEAGWGPKLVTEIRGSDRSEFLYITKPMDERTISKIRTVGTKFNLFQPPQQKVKHNVNVEPDEGFTIIRVRADAGDTLENRFESIIEHPQLEGMDVLFRQIIGLYLQDTVDHLPALGFVAPIKYGKEWKYGYEWTVEKNPQLEFLLRFEKTAPFLVPLRWDKEERTRFITLLHGDEWGGNFMAPPSDAGSIRPIDFEDAHIQHIKIELDPKNNIRSYLATSQGQDSPTSQNQGSHLSAGGKLAYRVTSYWSGEAPPLHAYSAMSALGRLFAALVQKQTLKTNPQEVDVWIEEATALFFNILRNSLNAFTSSTNGTKYLTSLGLDPEITQRGLMVRAVLAAYNWSEHWTCKTRDHDGDEEWYKGKWKKSSLEEFQFQLGVQGEWEVCSRDSDGRPTTTGHDYAKILRNEIETSDDWTDVEKTDIRKAISLLEEFGNTGIRVAGKQYRELIYLNKLLPFEKSLNDVQFERRVELTKHNRLENKIEFINTHFLLTKEETRDPPKTTVGYLNECIKNYPLNEHWKNIWLIWRDIYSVVGRELPLNPDALWTMQVNFDAQIHGENINQFEKILNTFQTGTLAQRDEQTSVRNLVFSKHISYLNSFRKRIELSSSDDTSILIDSKISRFCTAISEAIFNNRSEMNYTDLDFLTKLMLEANEGDREFVETGFALDIPLFVMGTFAELGFNDKTLEIERFFNALSHSVTKCFSICAGQEVNDEENFLMECMLGIISHPKQQLLRSWGVEFIVQLNPQTRRALEDVGWYKFWANLEHFPSLQFSKVLDPTSQNYDFLKRFFSD
jgi:hypothetical protein